MELENEVGEVQVKLVLHVGNRQEEVVNNSENDKNKFSLKKSSSSGSAISVKGPSAPGHDRLKSATTLPRPRRT